MPIASYFKSENPGRPGSKIAYASVETLSLKDSFSEGYRYLARLMSL